MIELQLMQKKESLQNYNKKPEKMTNPTEPWTEEQSVAARASRGEGTSAPNKTECAVYADELEKALRGKNKTRVLVLGATPELRDIAIQLGAETIAVDFTQEILFKLTNVMKHKDSALNKLILADWLELGNVLVKDSFDAVLADASFNNVTPENHPLLLEILHKLLRPGGVFITRHVTFAPRAMLRAITEITDEYRAGKNTTLGFFTEIGLQSPVMPEAYNIKTKQFKWSIVCEKLPLLMEGLPEEKKAVVEKLATQAQTLTQTIFPQEEWHSMLGQFLKVKKVIALPHWPYTQNVPIYVAEKESVTSLQTPT